MKPSTMATLKRVADALGGASVADVLRGKRNKWACRIRHVVMLILRRRLLFQIGDEFGGLDHTTVMNACKVAERLEAKDQAVADLIAAELARGAPEPAPAPIRGTLIEVGRHEDAWALRLRAEGERDHFLLIEVSLETTRACGPLLRREVEVTEVRRERGQEATGT